MTTSPSPSGELHGRDLYHLLNELDRLEELLEEMTDLHVSSRADIELRLLALNREVDERTDA